MSKSKASDDATKAVLALLGGGSVNSKLLEKVMTGTVEIRREGEQIILPEGMSYDEGIAWLTREKLQGETTVDIYETFPGVLPAEGAVALAAVLRIKYGFVSPQATPGFFGPTPPTFVGVATGPGTEDSVQVPWGDIAVPTIEGVVTTGYTVDNGRPAFNLQGRIKQAHQPTINELARLMRQYIKEHSLYRGKAIRIDFKNFAHRDNPFDSKFMPKFMAPRRETVILNSDAAERLETELYTVIRSAEACRRNKIPLKRGVLLAGPYGTGKTLTAHDLSKEATENGWTFIYCEDSANLQNAIQFAQAYQPAVIFAEDIDKVLTENNDPEMVEIRNALDSIETKSSELLVVLTTNHIDKLPHGFMRHGRIDSIVEIDRPNSESTMRLVRHYANQGNIQLNADDTELAEAVQPIVGQAAATIRECVERSKLSAVRRQPTAEHPLTLEAKDLRVAAQTMAAHTKYLGDPPAAQPKHPALAQHEALVAEVAEAVYAKI